MIKLVVSEIIPNYAINIFIKEILLEDIQRIVVRNILVYVNNLLVLGFVINLEVMKNILLVFTNVVLNLCKTIWKE